jgi:hypothetical protein
MSAGAQHPLSAQKLIAGAAGAGGTAFAAAPALSMNVTDAGISAPSGFCSGWAVFIFKMDR